LTLLTEVVPSLCKSPVKSRRHLVFTSAGDRNIVPSWLGPDRDFDLWVVWYGRGADVLQAPADYYLALAGSKFQNLHYCFQHWPALLERYDAILIMDDDIRISAQKINRLFALREHYDLWALQPAFSKFGKISHLITRVRRDCELRFVDFIEMSCPLIRTDKLLDFLRVYDPALVGWGCDWWFMHTMGDQLFDRVAVIDSVVCLNPHDAQKPGGDREIDRLQSQQQRRETWERIRDKHGIIAELRGQHEFRCVSRTGWKRYWMWLIDIAERLYLRVARGLFTLHG
jgi:hypothetical protein